METRRRGAGTEHCPQPGSPELGQLGPSPSGASSSGRPLPRTQSRCEGPQRRYSRGRARGAIGGLGGGETPGEPSPDAAEGPAPAPLLLVSIAFLPLLNDRA
jgi:hypothetical protein